MINKFYTFYRVHENQRTNFIKKKIILKENFNMLVWSMKNRLISFNNIALFSKKFLIIIIKYFFVIIKN